MLLFILLVDGILAIIEDRRRHIADKEANSATCQIVTMDKKETTAEANILTSSWSDIRVGMIVKLKNRETAPADLVILSVHEPDLECIGGLCYVETKSLDGETNLKLRHAVDVTLQCQTDVAICELEGQVLCEYPNRRIQKFEASIETNGKLSPISIKNVILRGCQLRNTDYIYGLVVNSGVDTKIMQSSVTAPMKWSSINYVVNKMIIGLFFFLLVCCLIASTVQVIWNTENASDMWYLGWPDPSAAGQWFLGFGYYFLLMYQIIPVSLYVTIGMVMLFQAIFMVWDLDMYYEKTDTRAIVRSMSLNEELGQISYIFSDKTGTLTCNIMDFRKCSINGVSYGTGTTEVGRAAALRFSENPEKEEREKKEQQEESEEPSNVPFVNFRDPKLLKALEGHAGIEQEEKVRSFLLHLALCHTVLPEKVMNEATNEEEVQFSASSPDEQALVAFAKYFGYCFDSRGLGIARVMDEKKQQVVEYKLLHVFEFNSERKRMSLILREPEPSNRIMVLCKGADSALFPRLKQPAIGNTLVETTENHMFEYADEGLRTLCIAMKYLSDEDAYNKWKTKYEAASADLNQLALRQKGEKNDIDQLMEEMESELTLLGATAIEDKLQEGVPSAIARFRQAGIKVWILTGDKQETAINISYACQLIDNSMNQFVINTDQLPSVQAIGKYLEESLASIKNSAAESLEEYALIIDGEALEIALDPSIALDFLALATECKSVVCCRVSPSQKAQVVKLVKDNLPECRTLAIGDGANDVAMIKNAHIGVGISGQEGLQAVNSSDYAIAQFRFLEKLLLHHGRLNYVRMCTLVGYMFYKNILMVLVQYYYNFLAGSSGQKFYNELGFQLYNMIFTSLPIIYLGVFDYDVPPYVSVLFPELYYPGLKGDLLNVVVFFRWITAALFEAAVIFMFTVYGYNPTDGAVGSADLVQYGATAFTLVVVICNLKIILVQNSWTPIAAVLWLIGIVTWIPISLLISSYWIQLFPTDYGSFMVIMNSGIFWLIMPIACAVALGRHYTWLSFQRINFPHYWQVIQEHYLNGAFKMHNPDQTIAKTTTPYTTVRIPIREEGEEDDEYIQKRMVSFALKPSDSTYTNASSAGGSSRSLTQRRRSSGYAFSFDPDTTRKESFMASHTVNSTPDSSTAANGFFVVDENSNTPMLGDSSTRPSSFNDVHHGATGRK